MSTTKYSVCINDSFDDFPPSTMCVTVDYNTALNAAMNLNKILFGDKFQDLLDKSGEYSEVYDIFLINGGFGVEQIQYFESTNPCEIIEEYKDFALEHASFIFDLEDC